MRKQQSPFFQWVDGPMPPAGFSGRKSGAGRVAAALKAAKESSRTGPGRPGWLRTVSTEVSTGVNNGRARARRA